MFPGVWYLWVFVGVGLEVYALWSGIPGSTLSELVWEITAKHPLLACAFGCLMGHFFWQRVK